MDTHLDRRAGERRIQQRRRELTPGQKIHLAWMLSQERRSAERRAAERRAN
jgi:hypothetical protein